MPQLKNIYLCGVTQNQFHNIDELTKDSHSYFDGLIFVDAGSTDGTLELLEERAGCGTVLHRKWTNDHDLQMNEFLRRGGMERGDWFVIRDSRERFNIDWLKTFRELLNNLSNQGVRSIYNYGKGFAFAWNDNMVFQGSPHWGLQGAWREAIDLKDHFSEERKEHTWRIPDGEGDRASDNCIDHFFRYYFIYGRSNHLLLGRENNLDEYRRQEYIRIQYREYCHEKGIKTVEDMIYYMSGKDFLTDENSRFVLNNQKIMMDFYRKHVLGHSLEEIQNTEHRL